MSEIEIMGTEKMDGAYGLVKTDRERLADRLAEDLEGALVREDGSIEGRVRFARCPHCRRVPAFRRTRSSFEAATGVGDETLTIPMYEFIPCCTAHYSRVNEGLSGLQMRRLKEQTERAAGK